MSEKTPSQAQQQIDAIRADPTHAFFRADAPEHAAAVERMGQLYALTATPAPAPATRTVPPTTLPTTAGERSVRSVAEVKAAIGAMLLDRSHPINNADHPAHALALQERLALTAELLEAEKRPAPAPEAPPALPFELPTLPNGQQWSAVDEEFVREAAPIFKDLGFSDAKTETVLRHAVAQLLADTADPVQTRAILEKEWGEGKAFQENLEAAQLALQRFPKSIQSLVRTSALGDDPLVLRLLAEAGRPMLEAKRKKEAMFVDRSHPLHHPEDAARHRAARAEFDAYQTAIYGPAYARR